VPVKSSPRKQFEMAVVHNYRLIIFSSSSFLMGLKKALSSTFSKLNFVIIIFGGTINASRLSAVFALSFGVRKGKLMMFGRGQETLLLDYVSVWDKHVLRGICQFSRVFRLWKFSVSLLHFSVKTRFPKGFHVTVPSERLA